MIKNDGDLLNENGYIKIDKNQLCLDFENIIMERNEEYLDYFKNEEESIIKRFHNK